MDVEASLGSIGYEGPLYRHIYTHLAVNHVYISLGYDYCLNV